MHEDIEEESGSPPPTPIAGITPRASYSNIRQNVPTSKQVSLLPSPSSSRSQSPEYYDLHEDELIPTELEDLAQDITSNKFCRGQRIQWVAGSGSIWETYAYQIHADDSVPWHLEGFEQHQGIDYIIIRSEECYTGSTIKDMTEEEVQDNKCGACSALRNSAQLREFITRAKSDPKPCTPWKYLNIHQLKSIMLELRKQNYEMQMKVSNIFWSVI